MTERDFAVDVVRRLQSAGFEALFAGGCVRDELLGLVPADYDVATSAPPDTVRDHFKRTIAIGASFGVIEVLGPRGDDGEWLKVQVATFRSDGAYTDGRRPDSVSFGSAEEDAARRDFTINGLFLNPADGRVIDYVGGQADLQARVLRAIGDPFLRFAEDKLRLLRAVRMAARFELQIDPGTFAALRAMAPEINVVSAERIAEELRKILTNRHRVRGYDLMLESGLLQSILAEAKDADGVADRLAKLADPTFELALATLMGDSDKRAALGLAKRLKLSNSERDSLVWLLEHRRSFQDAHNLPRSVLYPLLAHPGGTELVALHHASGFDVRRCEDILRTVPIHELDPPPLLTGDDLRELGYSPGPAFKRWLEALRAAQLDGEVADRASAIDKIAALASIST